MPSPSPPKGSSPRKGRKGVKAFKALSAKRGGGGDKLLGSTRAAMKKVQEQQLPAPQQTVCSKVMRRKAHQAAKK